MMSVRTGQYYGLDAVGRSVWRLLATPKSFGHIVDHVVDRFGVDSETAARDLQAFIMDLEHEGLVSVDSGAVAA